MCLLNLCFWRFLRDRTGELRCKYKKQRNVCVYLLKIDKKDYYENIYLSNLTDSNKFWKALKPIFGCKIKSKNSIILIEGTKFIQEEEGELASFWINEFFVSIIKKSWNQWKPSPYFFLWDKKRRVYYFQVWKPP